MDARRFDAIAKALSSAPSRREVIRNFSLLAAAAVTLKPGFASADSGSGGPAGGSVTTDGGTTTTSDGTDGAGGTSGDVGGNAVCLPIAKTGADSGFLPPFYAEIIEGTCDTADGASVFELIEIDAGENVVAVPPAAFMSRSVTTVESSIDDLVDTRYSIVVRISPDDPTIVSCGEIGGVRQDDELAVGIKERNNSGYSGVSLIRGTNGTSLVYVFLGRGLSTVTTAPAAVGSAVVTTTEVNLRDQPAVDSNVIEVIPAGTQLNVLGSSVGDWVPVEDPETGSSGYVSGEFVEVVS